jgi:hypothetical protein
MLEKLRMKRNRSYHISEMMNLEVMGGDIKPNKNHFCGP